MVDFREDSPSYLKWEAIVLDGENQPPQQVFIPGGCGHGILSREEGSLLVYGQEGVYDPKREMNVNPFDPVLGILWPQPCGSEYIISDQDQNAPPLQVAKKLWQERNK
eukprot:TRINITY_DN9565_c0_g2_i1.p1 TRINITY_DN9565_c0_g2~~TRINITY_DN9565_c0_g2_i1.p1  ORF type:complete len:108 (-),score=23.06 TRINITY_DN9565_c0_g2_i1:36-359(-)